MIKIENKYIDIDGAQIPYKNIHIVKSFGENDLYFLNIRNGKCTQYPYKLEELYEALRIAGKSNFILVENWIVNCCKIDRLCIQTAKDTLTGKMGFALHVVFDNNRDEEIFFDTHIEAERYYHIIDSKITDIKNEEAIRNLMQ